MRQNVAAEREAALAEKATLEKQAVDLVLQLEGTRTRLASAEATVAQQREEIWRRLNCWFTSEPEQLGRLRNAHSKVLRDRKSTRLNSSHWE